MRPNRSEFVAHSSLSQQTPRPINPTHRRRRGSDGSRIINILKAFRAIFA